jgi:hypothetical protein
MILPGILAHSDYMQHLTIGQTKKLGLDSKESIETASKSDHQSLMPSLLWEKIDPSDFFLGCENEGLKLEVQHFNYLVYLMKKNLEFR